MPALVDLSGAVLQRQIFSPSIVFGPGTYLTIEEDPEDDSEITQHPVDSGAVMSDHWYLKPPELKLRLGWSNADPQSTGASYVRNIYSRLLQLKNNRQLFTVYTGKRLYYNMAIPSLRGPVTNPTYEYSMIVDLLLRQVLLVQLAAATSVPTSVNAAPNPQPNNVVSAPTNQPTQNTGSAQTTVVNLNATGSSDAPDLIDRTPEVPEGPSVSTNSNGGGAGPTDAITFENPI